MLKITTPEKTIEYRHNALGNRVAKLINGQVVEKYLWQNKTTLLAIYDANDNLKQRFEYTLGHAPIAFIQNGEKYFILSDQIGSPRIITDANGYAVKEITYDSYGNILSDSNEALEIPFGFAGGLQDKDTGLLRFGYRDYDPETGRWTARDPIGFEGGDSNLYGYVLGDPVNLVDPTGLIAWDTLGKQIGSTILKLGPNIDSQLERQMIDHFFYGGGIDFTLTKEQTDRYRLNPRSSEFDYGIGRENPSKNNSRIDRYDFDPQAWGNRTVSAEIATRIANLIGILFGGEGYDVYLYKDCR